MSQPAGDSSPDRLESWKEIAAYLRRDVRTVQRWERSEGLPIYRHRHRQLDSVYAFRGEVDTWRQRRIVAPQRAGALPPAPLPGRARMRANLDDIWRRARHGSRQLAFVTGELGIGKTALIRAFLADRDAGEWATVGHSVAHFGASEPYLPILEAVSALCGGPYGQHARAAVRRYASCLAPRVLLRGTPSKPAPPADIVGPDRLVLELIALIEGLAAHKPLVFVLEDVHWADPSTMELLSRLAQRRDSVPLLVLLSYRSDDLAHGTFVAGAMAELVAHFGDNHIPLSLLNEAEVAEWLAQRGPWHDLRAVAASLHQRTEGNPLFLTQLLHHLITTGRAAYTDRAWELDGDAATANIPASLEGVIASRIDCVEPFLRSVVGAASVAGVTFAAVMVAHLLDSPIDRVESALEQLVKRHQLLRRSQAVEWPDGTVLAGYAFVHQFVRDVAHNSLIPSVRAELHHRATMRLEDTNAPDTAAARTLLTD